MGLFPALLSRKYNVKLKGGWRSFEIQPPTREKCTFYPSMSLQWRRHKLLGSSYPWCRYVCPQKTPTQEWSTKRGLLWNLAPRPRSDHIASQSRKHLWIRGSSFLPSKFDCSSLRVGGCASGYLCCPLAAAKAAAAAAYFGWHGLVTLYFLLKSVERPMPRSR